MLQSFLNLFNAHTITMLELGSIPVIEHFAKESLITIFAQCSYYIIMFHCLGLLNFCNILKLFIVLRIKYLFSIACQFRLHLRQITLVNICSLLLV